MSANSFQDLDLVCIRNMEDNHSDASVETEEELAPRITSAMVISCIFHFEALKLVNGLRPKIMELFTTFMYVFGWPFLNLHYSLAISLPTSSDNRMIMQSLHLEMTHHGDAYTIQSFNISS